jgi:hypothetical protein
MFDKRVAADDDDAEESASGSVGLSSSDLEMVRDSNNQTVGVRFTGVTIPPGATIVQAWVQFTVDQATTEATNVTVAGQASDDAATFARSTGNISSRPRTVGVSWSVPPWSSVGVSGPAQRSPDIASVIQQIVDRPGWTSGNALALIIIGTGRRTAEAFESGAATAAWLHVEYGTGPTTTTTTVTTTTTTGPTTTTTLPTGTTTTTTLPAPTGILDRRIAAKNDDAEQQASGSMVLSSSDLELVNDGSAQTVGLRFTGITIPPGATITRAYLQFTVDEATSEVTTLSIEGQASDNALAFSSATGNISSRPRTATPVVWSVPNWSPVGAAGPAQQSPDISSLVQQIVNRAGWTSGNSLALIITGTGRRAAEAFESGAATAPLLHVEYAN